MHSIHSQDTEPASPREDSQEDFPSPPLSQLPVKPFFPEEELFPDAQPDEDTEDYGCEQETQYVFEFPLVGREKEIIERLPPSEVLKSPYFSTPIPTPLSKYFFDTPDYPENPIPQVIDLTNDEEEKEKSKKKKTPKKKRSLIPTKKEENREMKRRKQADEVSHLLHQWKFSLEKDDMHYDSLLDFLIANSAEINKK